MEKDKNYNSKKGSKSEKYTQVEESDKSSSELLKGIDPKALEKVCEYFQQRSIDMIFSSIDRIEETAKTIMGSSAILSGIYFAVLKVSPVDALNIVSRGEKLFYLSPLFIWFFSFILSFLAISRKGIDIDPYGDSEVINNIDILQRTSRKKYLFLEAASFLLSTSILLLIAILILVFFLT